VPITARKISRILLFPLGLALLMAAFLIQEGMAFNVTPQTTPMPTLDRLAEPTLPAEPSPADHGAQVYWLYCMPCHGDKGQGLTDEFRDTYPPEDNNCWGRGCHGRNPYEGGFTLPTIVPQVIGPGSLTKFATGANLNGFIRAAMPFEDPGVLSEEQAWQVTAFILRENGITYPDGLGASNAEQILIAPPQTTPTPPATPGSFPSSSQVENPLNLAFVLSIFLLGGILFLWHTLRRKQNQP
jgi:cytochrome c